MLDTMQPRQLVWQAAPRMALAAANGVAFMARAPTNEIAEFFGRDLPCFTGLTTLRRAAASRHGATTSLRQILGPAQQ
jgi:hypothetical protein